MKSPAGTYTVNLVFKIILFSQIGFQDLFIRLKRHDLPTSVKDIVSCHFASVLFSYEKFPENKALAKFSEFTVSLGRKSYDHDSLSD